MPLSRIPFFFWYFYLPCVCVCAFIVFIGRQHRHGNALFQLVHSNQLLLLLPCWPYLSFKGDRRKGGGSCGNCQRLHWPSIRPSSHPWVDPFIHFHRRSYPSFLLSTKRIPSDRRVRQKNRKIKETHTFHLNAGFFSLLWFEIFRFAFLSSRPPRRAPPDRKSISPLRKRKKKPQENKTNGTLFCFIDR